MLIILIIFAYWKTLAIIIHSEIFKTIILSNFRMI